MKKFISILVLTVMMVSVFTPAVFAAKKVKTTDETTERIIVVDTTRDFMSLLSKMPNNVIITGKKNIGTVIELDQATSIKLNGLNNVEFTNLTFTNMKYVLIENSTNVKFSNVKFSNFSRTGLYLDNTTNVEVSDSVFTNMGNSDINVTYQGNAIYAENSDNLLVQNNIISETYGLGSVFVTTTTNFVIDNNEIYNTSLRAIEVYKNGSSGMIKNNYVHDIGTLNTSGSGVGANGIFAEAEAFEVDVINNTVINLLENGIEGKFRLVEGNLVDGTGMDLENFPTPSTEGIYANGLVYRNNVVRNTNGDGIKVYSSSEISNLTIINNDIKQTVKGYKGITLISDIGYSNVLIENNTIDNYNEDIFVYNMAADATVTIAMNTLVNMF